MVLENTRMINNEFMNKIPYVVPEQALIIILDVKLAIGMDNNGIDIKQTRHIYRRLHLVRHGEEWNFHKAVWCEGGPKLEDIGTKSVRQDELNRRLRYDMVRLENWKNTCQKGVTRYKRVWITMSSKWLNWIELRIWLNEYEIVKWV